MVFAEPTSLVGLLQAIQEAFDNLSIYLLDPNIAFEDEVLQALTCTNRIITECLSTPRQNAKHHFPDHTERGLEQHRAKIHTHACQEPQSLRTPALPGISQHPQYSEKQHLSDRQRTLYGKEEGAMEDRVQNKGDKELEGRIQGKGIQGEKGEGEGAGNMEKSMQGEGGEDIEKRITRQTEPQLSVDISAQGTQKDTISSYTIIQSGRETEITVLDSRQATLGPRSATHPKSATDTESLQESLQTTPQNNASGAIDYPLQPCQNTCKTVKYKIDGKLFCFLPTPEQWEQFPTLLSFAKELGAGKTGAFKIIVPEPLRYTLQKTSASQRECRGYRSKSHLDYAFKVTLNRTRAIFQEPQSIVLMR